VISVRWPVSAIKTYHELEVWQKAMDLVIACYRVAESFPKSEVYGLTIQLQRAGVSVPANIAEGQGRNHTREFIDHLSIAYGSLMEVETLLQIAARLTYMQQSELNKLLLQTNEIGRMLNGLMRSLNRKLTAEHRPPNTGHCLYV
jgi:four helix bundle protein